MNEIFFNEPRRREEHEGRTEKFFLEIVCILPKFRIQSTPQSIFFCESLSFLFFFSRPSRLRGFFQENVLQNHTIGKSLFQNWYHRTRFEFLQVIRFIPSERAFFFGRHPQQTFCSCHRYI